MTRNNLFKYRMELPFNWCQIHLCQTLWMRQNVFTRRLVIHWPSLETEVIRYFIHWFLISYYYVSSWIKIRPGRLYPRSMDSIISHMHCQIWKQIILKHGDPSLGWKSAQECFCTDFVPVVTSRVNNYQQSCGNIDQAYGHWTLVSLLLSVPFQ